MCLSFVGQIIFGALMVATLGLTVASMFSPGWRNLTNKTENAVGDLKKFKIIQQFGIFPFLCRAPTDNNKNDGTDENSAEFCKEWFNKLSTWEKVVVAFMCLALISEVVTIVWTLVSCCGCCCKTVCLKLLPLLALIVAAFLAVAVIVFGINNKNGIGEIHFNGVDIDNIGKDADNIIKDVQKNIRSEVGYSFYMACGALAGAVIDFFVAWISLCLSKFCC